MENLSEFDKITPEAWKTLLDKELKNITFEQLRWTVAENFKAEPAYLEKKGNNITCIPKNRTEEGWKISKKINLDSLANANNQALFELMNGANELIFEGKLAHSEDLKTLLKDIKTQHISVFFNSHTNGSNTFELIADFIKNQRADNASLHGGIWFDPISTLLTRGNWFQNEYRDFEACGTLISNCIENHFSNFKPISINSTLYHLAGADAIEELACTLAHTNEYFNWLRNNNIDLNKGAKHFNYRIAIGRGYYTQICKLRALRPLLANLYAAHEIDKINAVNINLSCETSCREQALSDPYNNLLRATTQAMSAVIGGCDSLLVHPHDSASGSNSDFSERIAKNIQLILNEEAFIGNPSDAASGAYLFEQMTEELMQKAWNRFKEIEASGGLIENLKNGSIQKRISLMAKQSAMEIEEGLKIYVGVNKYHSKEAPLVVNPNKKETILESKQVEQLNLERATLAFENKSVKA